MYIGWHNHSDVGSNQRFKDSINRIPDMIAYSHELGHKGICFTDHESVSNAIRVENAFNAVKDKEGWEGFKVALGNEIYLCKDDVKAGNNIPMEFPHFLLIALNARGHEQLRELSTRAWSRAFMKGVMRVPTYLSDIDEIIGIEKGNVVGASACLGGIIPKFILKYRDTGNEIFLNNTKTWISVMKDMFGDGNFFLEMQSSDLEDQWYVNKVLLSLSEELDVPYVITTDSHYLKKEDRELHRIYLTSQDADRETDSFYSATYIQSEEEIHGYLDHVLGAEAVQKGIDNTCLIYDRIESYSLKHPLHIPYMPLDETEPDKRKYEKYADKIAKLKEFYESPHAPDRHLVREIAKALDNDASFRDDEMYKHLDVCLDAIWISSEKQKTQWSAYLLQMKDYIDIIWDKGKSLVGLARGSGTGFGLLDVLGITQINPLKERTATFPWRFLNPERASPLDIDIDIAAHKRDAIMRAFYEVYGADKVSKVLTYQTEGSKAAILTAARGLGIDNDIASYIASLVLADRGMTRSLHTMYYGDDDNQPVREFVNIMNEYPKLWEYAQKIEGLVCGVGSHAGGVIFVDEPFTKTTSLMKTNSGDKITCFDLHECEDCGLIKIDLLSTEAESKIQVALELLLKDGVIEWQGSLRKTYEKYFGIKTLERDDIEMWKLLWNHKVLSMFQFEKDSGIQAISLFKPKSVDELATLNSVIRLMAQEKGGEIPLHKFARFKQDINQWYKEMRDAGLTQEEQDMLKEILGLSYGICAAQELMMILVMKPEIGGFSLTWADRLRKAVAKKKPKDFLILEKEYFENAREKGLSENLVKYVWYELLSINKG